MNTELLAPEGQLQFGLAAEGDAVDEELFAGRTEDEVVHLRGSFVVLVVVGLANGDAFLCVPVVVDVGRAAARLVFPAFELFEIRPVFIVVAERFRGGFLCRNYCSRSRRPASGRDPYPPP